MKEALERAEALKKRANTVLVDTRYPEAVEQYTLGIKVRSGSRGGQIADCRSCGCCQPCFPRVPVP